MRRPNLRIKQYSSHTFFCFIRFHLGIGEAQQQIFMGLIKLLYHGKEMSELEEVLKLLVDKMRSIYGPAKIEHYNGISKIYFPQTYGYGEFICPRTDISFTNDVIERLRESHYMTQCASKAIIIKRNDYNRFNEISVEFSHKFNRYTQLLHKTETPMDSNMRNILRNYIDIMQTFNYSYKYVVE